MANGASPLQQFIQNHMAFEQFKSHQQAVGAQMSMQQRQIENQEINQFAALAPFVEHPEQRAALAAQFGQRMPHMADTFTALAQTIPISEQVYRSRLIAEGLPGVSSAEVASTALTGMNRGQAAISGATAGRSAEDIVTSQRIGEGQVASAGQNLQNQQFIQDFFERRRQFDAQFEQRRHEFGVDTGLRNRQLGISEFEAAQRGEGQRLNFMAAIGEGRPMLRGDLSTQLREIDNRLSQQGSTMRPEARAALQRERSEVENAMRQLDNRIAADMAALMGKAGGSDGLSPNQLVQAIATARSQHEAASTKGAQEEALYWQQYLSRLLAQTDPSYQPPQLEVQPGFMNKLGRQNAPGVTRTVPTPFESLFGGQR